MSRPDDDTCYRAVTSRDARFDGWFFVGVTSTGIYCRPSCPASTPKRQNVQFHSTSAAAQSAGFRSCKRCRPDAVPGSPEWNIRGDLAARAIRLIGDGTVDRDGVDGLARRLGYSSRQLGRVLTAELGTGPIALARANRSQTARILLQSTALPVTDIAFAAGFSSVRQFNDTIRETYAQTPSELRAMGRDKKLTIAPERSAPRPEGAIRLVLRLPFRAPLDADHLVGFLSHRTIRGVESIDSNTFTRTLDLPGGPGLAKLDRTPAVDHLRCELLLTDQRDLTSAMSRLRLFLDLDADPVAVDEAIAHAPDLALLVAERPGMRSPGTVDGFEIAVRALGGQLVSLTSAQAMLSRITADHGRKVELDNAQWYLFPSARTLAAVDPLTLPLRRTQAAAIVSLAQHVDAGEIDLGVGADRDETEQKLLEIRGIGRWTARYVRMRALHDPDVLMTGDLVLDRWLAARPHIRPADFAPWRSYLTHHIWTDSMRTIESKDK